MKIVHPSISIEHPVDGDAVMKQIEKAGRVCYKSECRITPDSAAAFVKRLIDSKHESVLEHYSISVRIICDRGVSHEIVRHRIASYSQESTRYCNYGKADEIQVIEPLGMTQGQAHHWKRAMEDAELGYMDMLREGATPQIARSVLPNSLKTELVMTANLREWRHFFRLRTSLAAHPQMREVALMILVEFRRLLPAVFADIEAPEVPASGCVAPKGSPK